MAFLPCSTCGKECDSDYYCPHCEDERIRIVETVITIKCIGCDKDVSVFGGADKLRQYIKDADVSYDNFGDSYVEQSVGLFCSGVCKVDFYGYWGTEYAKTLIEGV